MATRLDKLKTILRTWKFLYRYERFGILWGFGLIVAGLYPTLTAWISKEIINSVLTPGVSIVSWLPDPYLYGITYGVVTLLQGVVISYSAIALVTIKDRTAAVTDQLLMSKAATARRVRWERLLAAAQSLWAGTSTATILQRRRSATDGFILAI